MSPYHCPGPSNIFNFSWIERARFGLQVLEKMYIFTKHQLYLQTSCFYPKVFENIHEKNICYSKLLAKHLALKIFINNEWVVFAKLPKKSNQLSPHRRAPFQV